MTNTRKYRATIRVSDLTPEDQALIAAVQSATAEAAKADTARQDAIMDAYDAEIPRDLIADAAGYDSTDAVQKVARRRRAEQQPAGSAE
jgi:hypothetical protein